MALLGKYHVPVYGAAIVTAISGDLYGFLFHGNSVYNKTTAIWDKFPVTLVSAHRLGQTVVIPNATNPIGVAFNVEVASRFHGIFDLVILDGNDYVAGLKVHIKADGEVVAVPE